MTSEIRSALRSMFRRPMFAAVVVATFAIGIGATTAIFSVVDGVLWRELPLADPDRVFVVAERDVFRGEGGLPVSPANFLDLRDQLRSFSGVAAFDPGGADLIREGQPETVRSARVSEDFFATFGLAPILGREFSREEHVGGAGPVVVLGHSFWRERYGESSSVLGQSIEIDGTTHAIVGVLPPRIPMARETSLWLPWVTGERDRTNRAGRRMSVFARLAPDATEQAASAELAALGESIARDLPDTNRDTRFEMTRIDEHLVGGMRRGFIFLLGAVGLILLLTCANVANLLLARAMERERELGVRSAIGASPARLVRHAAVETSILALAGGSLGVLLGLFGVNLIVALGPHTIPRAAEIGTDWRVLLFSLAITVFTAAFVSIAPALRNARPASILGLGSKGTSAATRAGGRDLLAAVQVALAFLLLTGAALLGRSFASVTAVDPGFNPDRVALLQMFIWDRRDSAEGRTRFFAEAIEALERLPTVEKAGAASSVPFAEVKIDIDTAVTGSQGSIDPHPGFVTAATPGYFEAIGAPLLRGRPFIPDDDSDGAPVAILSATMARRLFGDEEAIGRSIRMEYGRPVDREVVGITGDLLHDDLLGPGRAEVFIPHAQTGTGSMTLVVRTTLENPLAAVADINRAIWSVDSLAPIYSTHTLPERMSESVEQRRFILALIAGLSAIALLLAAVGTYGVISFSTRQRIPELGVRAALGAGRMRLGAGTVSHALRIAAAGVAVGACCAILAGRLLESMLVGVEPTDPLTFASAAAAVVLLTVAAALIPAVRAMRVDPAQCLRSE
ncbi:MAG: ABC transporter permease [Thermoanaerobaculia bacterium]